MRMFDVIEKKKHGKPLSTEEIRRMITEYVDGKIPEYQMSALLMAIYFKGMDDRELTDLTLAMAHSGDMVDLSGIHGSKVDKHSTGGVGDKTTLVIAPVVAACGGKVAKMSGRGLGHTGGTADKLESIPGYRIELSEEEFFDQVNKIGLSVITQSGNLTPADKKLYALRDVTATVDSIPLIAASVMSKKLAAGSEHILLDVTCGSGAFMKTRGEAILLAEKMVAIGTQAGRNVMALITDMDAPLGNTIGNQIEVEEAIEVLKGKGPEDLREICIWLATGMCYLMRSVPQCENGVCTMPLRGERGWKICEEEVRNVLQNGQALKKLVDMVGAQGGDTGVITGESSFAKAEYYYDVVACHQGYIEKMDAEACGIASMLLGAGRENLESQLDYTAGIRFYKKTGDAVELGDTIARLYSSSHAGFAAAEKTLRDAITIGSEKPAPRKLVLAKVTPEGVTLF